MEHDNQEPEKPKDSEHSQPSPPEANEQLAERLDEDHPRIWVGSLSDYNNGVLHGEWLDAARSADEIHGDIQRMLAASPTAAKYGDVAEEWGIFDYEGFGPARIDEHESISYVGKVAEGIAEHGLAYAAWADVMQDEELLDGFQDAYLGEFDSVEAYAEQLIDDLGYNQLLDDTLPEHVRRYVEINVAGLAQDMWLSGDVHVYHREGGGVWLFNSNI